MSSRLIFRGANVNYVNRFGKTAMHICVENNLYEQVRFLLFKGADPHIMNLAEMDACDIAKRNGLAVKIPEFISCNRKLKKIPILPDGS